MRGGWVFLCSMMLGFMRLETTHQHMKHIEIQAYQSKTPEG